MQPLLAAESIDLARMRSERFARLQTAMESENIDALVAIGIPNVHYAVGDEVRAADSARCHYERVTAVAFRGESHAHVFTPFPEGLPPELPGTFAAPLAGRQVWWAFTAAATAGGLAFAAFSHGWGLKALGAALIALPHLIGAPQPAQHGGLAPEAMMQAFVLAALATSLLYWIVLGALAGYFFRRFEQV